MFADFKMTATTLGVNQILGLYFMLHVFKNLFLCLVLMSRYSQAGELDACYQANFTQIDRILDLPPDVIGLVYASNHGDWDLNALTKEEKEQLKSGKFYLGISDRGGPFSSSSSLSGNEASLRLIMAAASDECILVAIEHGGAAHGAGMRVFLRESKSWVRGDKFDHPRAQLVYSGKYDTDLPSFISQASYELGDAFKYGQGVKKDLTESLKWYLLAANQGHNKAQSQLSHNNE